MATVGAAAMQQSGPKHGSIGSKTFSSRSVSATSLSVSAGSATAIGQRERNEDYCGFAAPEGPALETKGVVLALADGVGGARGARDASEHTVRGLLADYYATSDTWPVPEALDRVIKAGNRWLRGRAAAVEELAGMATTLSALVLRGSRYYVAHVGDTRIYLLRGERLECLTQDHVWEREDMRNVLTKAVGLVPNLVLDHAEGTIEEGDAFLLASDGVWKPLGDERMRELLRVYKDPERTAKELVATALAEGGTDNATAVVARIERVPDSDAVAIPGKTPRLAPPPRLAPSQWLDGFEVIALLHESREMRFYKVRDRDSGSFAVMKTLQPALANDADRCAALLAEEWLAARVTSAYFPQVIPLGTGDRSCLYYLTTFHEGATLRQRLDRGETFSADTVVRAGIQLVSALAVLHRLNLLHRDVQPDKVHLGGDDRIRLLDLGAAHESKLGARPAASFTAPELLAGQPADARSDLYAAGATLYHALTKAYPYGGIDLLQHPAPGDPTPPRRYRADIPQWLENVLLKSVAADPARRFETADEFLLALERGERGATARPARTPLVVYLRRAPWQSLAALSIALNLLLLWFLLAG